LNQPAPLVPLYPDEIPVRAPVAPRVQDAPRAQEPRQGQPARPQRSDRPGRAQSPAKPEWNEPAGSGRLEVETQPEMPAIPSPKPNAQGLTPKGFVVLAIGMPGSGKTTWFGRRGITPLSSDLLRNILFDDVEEQRYQGLVFSTLRSLLRARLIAKMPMNYVDATNLSIHERRSGSRWPRASATRSQAGLLRRAARCVPGAQSPARSLGERDIMRKMAEKLKPPVFEEGFENHGGAGEERG